MLKNFLRWLFSDTEITFQNKATAEHDKNNGETAITLQMAGAGGKATGGIASSVGGSGGAGTSKVSDENTVGGPMPVEENQPSLTPKEEATLKGEPYISILRVDVDPDNINNGSFELDWNDKFVLNLIKNGYKIREDDTDTLIVDRWFQTVCRNIALEVYEQEQADPTKRDDIRVIQQRDLGNGYTEVS